MNHQDPNGLIKLVAHMENIEEHEAVQSMFEMWCQANMEKLKATFGLEKKGIRFDTTPSEFVEESIKVAEALDIPKKEALDKIAKQCKELFPLYDFSTVDGKTEVDGATTAVLDTTTTNEVVVELELESELESESKSDSNWPMEFVLKYPQSNTPYHKEKEVAFFMKPKKSKAERRRIIKDRLKICKTFYIPRQQYIGYHGQHVDYQKVCEKYKNTIDRKVFKLPFEIAAKVYRKDLKTLDSAQKGILSKYFYVWLLILGWVEDIKPAGNGPGSVILRDSLRGFYKESTKNKLYFYEPAIKKLIDKNKWILNVEYPYGYRKIKRQGIYIYSFPPALVE